MTDTENQRAGFAAIIGAPNAGKSTLVNRLTGTKVSIVTQKVQTTRFPVRGIAIEGDLITLEFKDDCVAYNPLERPDPDLDA